MSLIESATDLFRAENATSRTDALRGENEKSKIWLRRLKVLNEQERYGWCVWKVEHNKKVTIDVFRGQNATRKITDVFRG